MAAKTNNKNAVTKDLLGKLLNRLVTADNCWVYSKLESNGYGRITHDGKRKMAHRAVYEMLVGDIPDGLQLDHLCRNTACINPAHLEPVTIKENLLRGFTIAAENSKKTHCKHGHEFTKSNTYHPPKRPERRYCITCQSLRGRRLSSQS